MNTPSNWEKVENGSSHMRFRDCRRIRASEKSLAAPLFPNAKYTHTRDGPAASPKCSFRHIRMSSPQNTGTHLAPNSTVHTAQTGTYR